MTEPEQAIVVPPGQIQRITGPTIAAGQSLSSALDITGSTLLRINSPAAWAAAPLSAQISSDGTQWWDVFDRDGHEFIVQVMNGGCMLLDPNRTLSACWLKFRSGSRASPIKQPADAVFSVVVKGN